MVQDKPGENVQNVDLQHEITMLLHDDPRVGAADKVVEVRIDGHNYFFSAKSAREVGDNLYRVGASARGAS